ncbi:MAG: hypothetical protein Q4A43_02495 [Coriobacteriia bacterium]|nr:hypothetical protein [Coriobacteriia bacterium]
MATRNPMNERNTTSKPSGQTRKSAASAKPVTKAAASVYVKDTSAAPKKKGFLARMSSSNQEPETSKERKAREQREAKAAAKKAEDKARRSFRPKTAEYKKWRIVFFAFLAAGLVIMLIATAFSSLAEDNYIVYTTLLILAWGCLTGAIVTDIKKVKPARDEAYYASVNVRNKSKNAKKSK